MICEINVMFLQTVDTIKFISSITFHVIFILHVSELTFRLGEVEETPSLRPLFKTVCNIYRWHQNVSSRVYGDKTRYFKPKHDRNLMLLRLNKNQTMSKALSRHIIQNHT